ncbi:sugar ABC transporter substrate-binding protein [Alicyclobacillus fastidiosus]|uniref:Sugar ABC transporter substrate-binding protein n=1 Tax=Alicyclobacillus fastidiosus TaxID=392011 RepID=A0ABY6ZLZ4_9BACL|nr:sugar ABC transporter substrate-binding protein [Alicyclobacillus fastidiosus]WAH43935.1 sugar ABC transporter substrate-binding protein [Alicyclobacillus fastidiosus]GMA60188.1 sugar ABC transporter substrate-binding protein [Alicyclobacillus fastidiosus]
MPFRKKQTSFGIVGVATIGLSALVTGCGSQSTGNSTGTTSTSGQKIHLTMTVWGSTLDTKTYQERVDLYTKLHPNVTITVKNLPKYDQQVETMIAGGDAPDIMAVSQDAVGFGQEGAVLNLTPYIKQAGMNLNSIYEPGYLGEYQYQGQQYGLPDRGGYIITYYNKDMFKKAGLTDPTNGWTWNQFLTDAKKLTITNGGKTTQWGFAGGTWWPVYGSFVQENGGKILNSSLNQSELGSSATQNALTWVNNLSYKWHVAPTTVQYANMGSGVTGDELFGQGKVALLTTGFWDIASYVQDKINFGIAPMPVGKQGGMETVGTGLAVCAKSKYPQVAFQVLEFLESKAGQAPIVQNGEDVPATKAGMAMWIKSLPKSVSFSSLQSAQSDVFSPQIPPQWNQLQTSLSNDLTPFFNGEKSLNSILSKTNSDVNSLVGGN